MFIMSPSHHSLFCRSFYKLWVEVRRRWQPSTSSPTSFYKNTRLTTPGGSKKSPKNSALPGRPSAAGTCKHNHPADPGIISQMLHHFFLFSGRVSVTVSSTASSKKCRSPWRTWSPSSDGSRRRRRPWASWPTPLVRRTWLRTPPTRSSWGESWR